MTSSRSWVPLLYVLLISFLVACGGGGGGGGGNDDDKSNNAPQAAPNDAPVITSGNSGSAVETRIGTTYVAAATDPDGDPVSYGISGDDAGLFTIDAASGVVAFVAAPDFEAPLDLDSDNVYDFEVTASDGKGGSGVIAVSISVTDIGKIPALEISYPTANANLGGEATQTTVSGNVVDLEGGSIDAADITSLSVGGQLATFEIANPSRWSVVVPVLPGINNLAVSFTDGDAVTSDSTLTLDNQAVLDFPRGMDLDAANNRVLVADVEARTLVAIDITSGLRSTVSSNQKGTGVSLVAPSDVVFDSANNRALVIDRDTEILIAIDPGNGNRMAISGGGTGSGVNLSFPEHLVLDAANDRVLVIDQGIDAIVAIDLLSGLRTIVSNSVTGSGPDLDLPAGAVLDSANNRLLLVDWGLDALLEIDLSNGNRAVLSNSVTGTGGNFLFPADLMLDAANNRVLVTEIRELIAVDLATGNRTVFADITSASVNYGNLQGVLLDAANTRILALDNGSDRLLAFDVGSANQSVISDDSTGGGFKILSPEGLVLDSDNARLLVIDDGLNSLTSVDLASGQRTLISGDGTGGGSTLTSPEDLVLETAANRVLVVDSFRDALVEIDLASGDRAVVSDDVTGVGNPLLIPRLVDLDSAMNRVLVGDAEASVRALLAIDPGNGNRGVVSDDGTGSGSGFSSPSGVAVDSTANRALLADRGSDTLFLVDLATGNRIVRSNAGTGAGTGFSDLLGVAYDSVNNRALAANGVKFFGTGEASLFAVDLTSGDRTVLSDTSTGSGPVFQRPEDIAYDSAHNRVFLSDPEAGLIVVVDLDSGERAVFSK